jgi:hypothetical protein
MGRVGAKKRSGKSWSEKGAGTIERCCEIKASGDDRKK